MTQDELRQRVESAVAKAVAPLRARFDESKAAWAASDQALVQADRSILEMCVTSAAKRIGQPLRPGGEKLIVEKAQAAGWRGVPSDAGAVPMRYDEDGRFISNELNAWLQENLHAVPFAYQHQVNRQHFQDNLSAIARGEVQVERS